MNFSLILVIEFPKKKIMEVLRIKNLKYEKYILNLLIVSLINIFLFVRIKQTSMKDRSPKDAIQMCSLKKTGKTLEKQL